MAHKANLEEIGREGFAIIEQHFVRKGSKPYPPQKSRAPHQHQSIIHRKIQPICNYAHQPQESLVCHANIGAEPTLLITAYDNSFLHDAAAFMDFPRRRSTRIAA